MLTLHLSGNQNITKANEELVSSRVEVRFTPEDLSSWFKFEHLSKVYVAEDLEFFIDHKYSILHH